MKFYVKTKKKGEEAKKKIREVIKDKDIVNGGDIFGIWGEADKETYTMVWESSNIRKNMKLRETKTGWFLYLPEPKELVEPTEHSIVENKCGTVQLDCLGLRTCRVISKHRNIIQEEFGFFHQWFELKVPKSDGTELMYPIGIVEMQDGTVRQVKPDHIIFGWEE